jgi:hypothetical protein
VPFAYIVSVAPDRPLHGIRGADRTAKLPSMLNSGDSVRGIAPKRMRSLRLAMMMAYAAHVLARVVSSL